MIKIMVVAFAMGVVPLTATAQEMQQSLQPSMEKLESELVSRYGEDQRARLRQGMRQVAQFWRSEDGDAAAFESLVRTHFAGDPATLDELFTRFEYVFEQLNGHMLEIGRALREQLDLDIGPILPVDRVLGGWDPSAHLSEDLFANKTAFIVLLNFPLTTLEERVNEGPEWTRRQWAEARLAQGFGRRIPAEVNQAQSEAGSRADAYIADYNLWMHHVLDRRGRRLFPAGMRLLAHWNLRDQIKADYAEKGEEALARQRTIQQAMERIVTQTIPQVVIDNPRVDWNPFTNEVRPSTARDHDLPVTDQIDVSDEREPDTRYAMLLEVFHAARLADPWSPNAPTHIARSFEENREIPEDRVRRIFEQVLGSPLVPRVASLIRQRVGRDLEAFDIWYAGFRPRGAYTEAELDAVTRRRYPDAEAYRRDMPRMLRELGFDAETAAFLTSKIEVDPARGSGHALGAARREDNAHLRTRIGPEGMDYKGYNIAVHEMGHNVEQVFSLNRIDHYFLEGVPNTAFTEALAFVFQDRDLELLGLSKPTAESQALQTLDDFWGTYEIAGVGLVDMDVWRWMYDNPDATPAQLREATVGIARDVWNRWYAPVLGVKDSPLLGIYSHMIHSWLYLPNYPLGHLIAHQIEEKIDESGELGREFERMSRIGNVTPDLWMVQATGRPVGAEALLSATERALDQLERPGTAAVINTESAAARTSQQKQ